MNIKQEYDDCDFPDALEDINEQKLTVATLVDVKDIVIKDEIDLFGDGGEVLNIKQEEVIIDDDKATDLTNQTKETYTCQFCSYTTKTKRYFSRHQRVHSKLRSFNCEICGYKNDNRNHFTEHLRIHTGEKPFDCNLCEFKTARKNALRIHMLQHTGKCFVCTQCDYKGATKERLANHLKVHTGERPFPCTLCNYRAAQKASLQYHMMNHMKGQPFTCDLCGYKTSMKYRLTQHICISSYKKKTFYMDTRKSKRNPKNKTVLEAVETSGSKRRPIPFTTPITPNQSFMTGSGSEPTPIKSITSADDTAVKNELEVEPTGTTDGEDLAFLRQVLDNFQDNIMAVNHIYRCRLCGYETSERYKIAHQHMVVHTGIKPYKCNICSYKAAFKWNLKCHMKTHKGKLLFECDQCMYQTKRKHYLAKHMRTHTQERLFECQYCGKKFGYEGNLDNHISVHHNK